jgi:endoglucanase
MANLYGIFQLFNGVIDEETIVGYGKVNPVDVFIFQISKVYSELILTQIKLRQFEGSGSNPTEIYGMVSFDDPNPTLLVSFLGGGYETWYTYDFDNISITYFKLVVGDIMPGEMQVYGTYILATPPTLFNIAPIAFSDMCGVNMFEWQILDGDNNNPEQILDSKLTALEAFNQIRHYLDWDKLENVQGEYCFNPASSGSWNYDAMYTALNGAGITVLACIKTQPAWMVNEYPSDSQDSENAPVEYIDGAQVDKTQPSSYSDYAKVLFQFTGRYGTNSSLDSNLLTPYTTNETYPPYSVQNAVEVALGIVNYIEVNNETDRWWKGLLSYQNAYEYAANLSACYDGHLNTMGDGIGIKNADPNMQVVMAGIAAPVPDYVMGIVDWCITNRGTNEDGSPNLPFDVINYHYYASSTDSANHSGDSGSNGICPELSTFAEIAELLIIQGQMYNVPVWITEIGYDEVAGSPIATIAIGSKTVYDVKADWTLRTSLMAARTGINKIFFYEAYDDEPNSGVEFATSGLLDATTSTLRKPAGDFLYQALNLLNGYIFSSSSIDDDTGAIIDIYNNGHKNAYVVLSPTQNDTSFSYHLDDSSELTVYQPQSGSNTAAFVGTSNTFIVSETPVFVILG